MSQRLVFVLSFLTIVVILGSGFYLEYFAGIIPCPLCTLQRICFGACGILFLIGIFAWEKRCVTTAVNLATLIFASLGIGLAGRQIWLQYHPSSDTSACGAGIKYMLDILPWQEVAEKIFSGSTECSKRGWEFLSLNIPEWSLLFFTGFFCISAIYLIRGCRQGCKSPR